MEDLERGRTKTDEQMTDLKKFVKSLEEARTNAETDAMNCTFGLGTSELQPLRVLVVAKARVVRSMPQSKRR